MFVLKITTTWGGHKNNSGGGRNIGILETRFDINYVIKQITSS